MLAVEPLYRPLAMGVALPDPVRPVHYEKSKMNPLLNVVTIVVGVEAVEYPDLLLHVPLSLL